MSMIKSLKQSKMPMANKFTILDNAGTRAIGPLEVLASVIQSMIEIDGRERTAGILEGMADKIRAGEFGGHVEPEQRAIH